MVRIETTRRGFLKGSAAVMAMGATPMTGLGKAADGSAKGSAWTIACRDAHLREVRDAKGKVLDTWPAMKAIKVEGVEAYVNFENYSCDVLIADGKAYSVADKAGIARLAGDLKSEKLKISAFCLHNQFDVRPEEEIKFTIKVSEIAAEMGIGAIRVDIVPRKFKAEDKAFLELAIDCMKKVVAGTKDLPVRYGVENHGHATNKPEFLRPLFGGVGSERFGLTLDTANFYWYGWPLDELYRIYDEFAATACHTHCKSVNYPEEKRNEQRPIGWEYGKYNCPVYKGDIDFKKVAAILKKNRYRGSLCIENESLGKFDEAERGEVLKKEAAMLRDVASSV